MAFLNFDRPNDPVPLTAEVAVKRGKLFVNYPGKACFLFCVLIGLILLNIHQMWATILAGILILVGLIFGWVWWSYSVPRWRDWALTRGADPDELQKLGIAAQLVWPKGHALEKTEFKNKDS